MLLMSGESIVSFSAAAADSISSSTKTHIDNNTTITESGQQQEKVAAAENNIYVTWSDTTFPEVDVLFRKSTDGGNTFGSTINLSNNPAV